VTSGRSLSLLRPLPVDRACGQAAVEPHWCACASWTQLNVDDMLVMRIGDALVQVCVY
jgi:hypothetical protein